MSLLLHPHLCHIAPDGETSRHGPRLSSLVGSLNVVLHLSFSKTQLLLDHVLDVPIARGAIAIVQQRLSAALKSVTAEAHQAAQGQPVAYVSAAAAMELLGHAFASVLVRDRYSACNQLSTSQRQLYWTHLIRDLAAITERQGASAEIGKELLALQRELFDQWHQWKDGTIDWPTLRRECQLIRLAFEQTLHRAVDLGTERG